MTHEAPHPLEDQTLREWALDMSEFAFKTHQQFVTQNKVNRQHQDVINEQQAVLRALEEKVVELTRRLRHVEGKEHAN